MIDLNTLVRDNIRSLKPYSSARDEFQGSAEIYLDANENAIGSPLDVALNRYPDPQQRLLKEKIGALKNIAPDKIFLGNGSDEAIDLLIRAFCEPVRDRIMIMPPTYGMYPVSATINNVDVLEVPLTYQFQIDVENVLSKSAPNIHLTFVCSPNNPSGNLMDEKAIIQLLENSGGLIVVDEAYIDFSGKPGVLHLIDTYTNLVVLQTFSKAWGMASMRLGMAFADPVVIKTLTNIKPPYNVNGLTQNHALEALNRPEKKEQMVSELIRQRDALTTELKKLNMVQHIFSSDANFLLVRFKNSDRIFKSLTQQGIIVRDRSKALYCENCLRITVGTEPENIRLLAQLKNLEKE